MKLYYKGGACSLASHIAALEAGIALDIEEVDLATKVTATGTDFRTINPKGYVPALILDDGEVMTESAVILQYIADRAPQADMIPPAGTMARYRALQLLSYIGGEIQKPLWGLIDPLSTDAIRAATHARIGGRIADLEERLATAPFLAGPAFSIVDAYAFAILGGARHFGVDFASFANIADWTARMMARPAVIDAMTREGLLPRAGAPSSA